MDRPIVHDSPGFTVRDSSTANHRNGCRSRENVATVSATLQQTGGGERRKLRKRGSRTRAACRSPATPLPRNLGLPRSRAAQLLNGTRGFSAAAEAVQLAPDVRKMAVQLGAAAPAVWKRASYIAL